MNRIGQSVTGGYRVLRDLLLVTVFIGVIPSGTAAERADNRMIEEILVVSTKKAQAEQSQDVPVAATVISADMIAENNYTDLVQIARLVPGADFRETATFPGIQRFWLRAVGVTFSVPNFDPAVGTYQDGIFIAQNIAAILDTFDMESVEVLRGPQGTLFGRNTSVGAVVTRSRRPGDEFLFRAEGTLGSFDRADIGLSVEGPLVKDRLLGKLTFLSRNKDGWVKDLSGGDKLGEFDTTHFRGTLVWKPTDAIEATLIGEHYERGGDGAISTPLGEFDIGRSGHPLLPGIARKWNETWGVSGANEPWPSFSDHEVNKLIADVSWDVGHGVITSVTGYVDVDAFSGADFDGLPGDDAGCLAIGAPITCDLQVDTRLWIGQDQISQELRYASSFSDTYDFTVGLYYFDQNLEYGEQRCCQLSQPNPYGVRPPGYDELDHDSFAIFADARVHLTDALTLLIGGRYTDESKKARIGFVNFGSCTGATAPPFKRSDDFFCSTGGAAGGFDVVDSESWKSFSPKIGLEYNVNDDLMLYSSITRGYRSGGFSFRAGPAELAVRDASIAAGQNPPFRPTFYDQERVDSLEVGMKSDWWDNRMRLNVVGYYQWWSDIQRNLQEGVPGAITQRTANVKDSHVYGLEIEASAIAGLDMLMDGDMLRLDTAIALADSGYDSDDYVILDPITLTVATDLTKQKFGAPHTTLFAAVSYEHPVGALGGMLSWRASYWYKAGHWAEGVHLPSKINQYEDKNEIDVSIQYTSASEKWYLRGFGRNLTYDKHYDARVSFGSNFGLGNPAQPRTWGLTVGYQN